MSVMNHNPRVTLNLLQGLIHMSLIARKYEMLNQVQHDVKTSDMTQGGHSINFILLPDDVLFLFGQLMPGEFRVLSFQKCYTSSSSKWL